MQFSSVPLYNIKYQFIIEQQLDSTNLNLQTIVLTLALGQGLSEEFSFILLLYHLLSNV